MNQIEFLSGGWIKIFIKISTSTNWIMKSINCLFPFMISVEQLKNNGIEDKFGIK